MLTKEIKNKQKYIDFWIRQVFILFVSIAFLSFSGEVLGQTSNQYSFTLNNAAVTSAGVYHNTSIDSSLIRTLWTTVKYNAGTYNINWDGKDDLGNQMPAGNYMVKVVSNNVQYTWMGVVGNTSTNNTGTTVHRGGYYYCMTGMTIVNGTAYCSGGYSEQSPSVNKFFTSNPQIKLEIEPFNTTTANTDIVVSDGTSIYYAAYDPYASNNTFMYAKKVIDDSDITFSNGFNFKLKVARGYNTIGYINQANSYITGLAVQKAGKYLFAARAGLNQLSVLDKGTGQLVQTLQVTNPNALCMDMNDNLWMVSDSNNVTKISKYKVNVNGTLSNSLLTISTISNSNVMQPIALAVSPDNSTLAVADGALSSQQIKAFTASTGIPSWTLGASGGYLQDATVTNNKFYFNDVRGVMYAGNQPGFREFIAFQPDGSFWVNDPGNYRVQHYAANQAFIETIMSMGPTYSTWADKNDNTRVGAEYLEFKIDNTQSITGSTGWQFVKNWGANISASYDKTTKFTNVITLTSSGVSKTFGFLRRGMNYYLVEFQSNNTLRFTGIVKPECSIERDGSLLTDGLMRYAFQGFDSANNPIWSSTPQMLANISTIQDKNPLPKQGFKNTYVTSTGKVIFYDAGIQSTSIGGYNTGFHLGAIQLGGNNYLWETAMASHRSYTGPFPDPAHFDIGNYVNNNAGSTAMVYGRNVVTGYHGEGWKKSQTNMYNHYLDNGLAIGQFGTVGPCLVEAPAMMAGNALSPQLVYGANNDELYLWHGDESFHAGLHKWKISGLNTIIEQDIPITYPTAALTPMIVPGSNLMVNLPYNSPLSNTTTNTTGWSFTPSTTSPTPSNSQTTWSIQTNVLVSGVQNNPDIYAKCNSASGNFSVNRDLGNKTNLNFWTLSGQISYYYSNYAGFMKHYFDVLDINGKIIARIGYNYVYGANNTIYGNNKMLLTGPNSSFIQPLMWQLQPIVISAVNNLVTIQYAGYTVTAPVFDPTADITSPKTMRAYFTGGYNPTGRAMDFKDMQFITTKVNQSINFNSIPTQTFGHPFALIASSSANLPVTFTVVSGSAQIAGNTIILTGTGNVVVQASQAGNTFYNAANPVTQSFNVTSQNISRIDH
ncbi:MAG: Ig family protein [Mucilaginibacter sp.]|nr:Ig family protein [Mucilaginibacter sp.]